MNNHGYPPIWEQECGNCRYSRATGRSDDCLSCRRHAPKVIPEVLANDEPTIWGCFPAVPSRMWCGEWAPEEQLWCGEWAPEEAQ